MTFEEVKKRLLSNKKVEEEYNKLKDEYEKIKKEYHNHDWHTGTPTEEGWYVYDVRGTLIAFKAVTQEDLENLSYADRWQKIE